MMENAFALDLDLIRERARAAAKAGDAHKDRIDRTELTRLLNEALATELICTLRYKSHAYRCKGIGGKVVQAEMFEHAREEWEHAERLAERIDQIGGEPDFAPDILLARSHTEYKLPPTVQEMVQEDLAAELIAIETYTELIRHIGDRDVTTRRLLEDILAKEEEHAADLSDMVEPPAPVD
jgi:bacterioferritin